MEARINTLLQYLDLFRANILRLVLKPVLLRHLYSQVHWRLAAGMILNTAVYLPLALFKPALLLVIGPLILGYPHMVASYRYTQKKSFLLFTMMTVVAIVLHLSGVGFAHIEQLPFGVWQIVIATFTLIISRVISNHVNFLEIIAGIILCAGLVHLAWLDPLIYVGGTLIIHNWIAFIFWIVASKENRRRTTALLSTLLFLFIHILVLTGRLDSLIPMSYGEIIFEKDSRNVGWYLASWSNDPIVWYRFLVIYTFGLSMHYFVWLRAIPENFNKFENPKSFRLIFKDLQRDLGKKTLIVTLCLIICGYSVWLFNLPLGTKIYFEVAILHGALELMFLFPKLLTARRRLVSHS